MCELKIYRLVQTGIQPENCFYWQINLAEMRNVRRNEFKKFTCENIRHVKVKENGCVLYNNNNTVDPNISKFKF